MPAWLPLFVWSITGTLIGAGIAWGVLRQRLATVEREIGTHDSGLRGSAHRHSGALLQLDGRVTALEQKCSTAPRSP